MPNILAIETSSEACSLAISNGDRFKVCHEVIPQQHTEKLLPLMQELMNDVNLPYQDLDVVATSMGATQAQKFRFVVIPGILGPLFGALRLSAIYSILAVVLGEFIVSKRGLGQRLLSETNNFGMSNAIALITILAGLALAFNAIIGMMERRFLKWQDTEARGKVVSL